MDNIEDDARYPRNPCGVKKQQGYDSSSHQKLRARNLPYSISTGNQYVDDEEDLGGEKKNPDQNNGVRDVGENINDDEELDDEEDDDDYDDEDVDKSKGYNEKNNDVDLERRPKKRKLKSLVSSYEFAPRVPASTAAPFPSVSKPSHGGRNSLTDWTERETFVLLDAWGDRFLQRGRKSLRSEEWQGVTEKVLEVSKIERTDTQCRNRLDTLKKYKKETAMLAETGATTSKWVYFRKMYMLMSTPPHLSELSCGLDSGEPVSQKPRPYSSRANGMDETSDSPASSESGDGDGDEDISDGQPPKKRRLGRQYYEGSSFRLLADSIHKFSDIYEKTENSKRYQMLELEKMRMDFHRELEMQKRQIMESAQAEIAKIQQVDEDDNDVSAENASR